MAKYKIIPSTRTIVQSPISIGHKAEKGVEAIEFDVTAWVETYGSGTLTVIMRRWGDAIPYPIALEIDENNKATWTLSDIDTAKAGMAYAQLSYIVGDEVVKKSDIYTFRVMDSLTGEGDPPEAYESWLEHLTHFAAEAMAEVLDIEGIVTDKTLTVDGGIADAKKTGDEIAAVKADLGALDTVSDPIKDALLDCFEHVALWTDGNGQTYIDKLKSALGSITPDLSIGTIISGYYDDTGTVVEANANYCNEKYFRIEEGTDYYWVQGYNGFVQEVNDAYRGYTNAYRICYYDENKGFISREINLWVTTEFEYVEPRYFKLTIPNGAKFFRVSWNLLPCGNIYKTIPTDVYAVTIVLANLDDSEIDSSSDLQTKFRVLRGGKDITRLVKTGNLNTDINDDIDNLKGWVRNIFNVLPGGSPEYGPQNPKTMTRIHNIKSYLMRKGDVISFNNVKAGVRAERISDGSVQHTTSWITDNSDFVIGGES